MNLSQVHSHIIIFEKDCNWFTEIPYYGFAVPNVNVFEIPAFTVYAELGYSNRCNSPLEKGIPETMDYKEWAASPDGQEHFRAKVAGRWSKPGAKERAAEAMREAHRQNPLWRRRTPEEVRADRARAKSS